MFIVFGLIVGLVLLAAVVALKFRPRPVQRIAAALEPDALRVGQSPFSSPLLARLQREEAMYQVHDDETLYLMKLLERRHALPQTPITKAA